MQRKAQPKPTATAVNGAQRGVQRRRSGRAALGPATAENAGDAVEIAEAMPLHEQKGRVPVMPLVLIGLGVMFLLNNLDLIRIRQILPYLGPCLLIGLGVYMLIARLKENVGHTPEVPHER